MHCQADFLVIRILVYVYKKLGISFFFRKTILHSNLALEGKIGSNTFHFHLQSYFPTRNSIYVPEIHVVMRAIQNEYITFLSVIILKSKLAMMKFVKTLLLESVD